MTRDVSVFVKCECDTIFRLFSLEITTNSNFNFRKVAYVIAYLRYVLYEILKIRYELTKLLPWVWCTTFLGHSVGVWP